MAHVVPNQNLHATTLRLLAARNELDSAQLLDALFGALGRLRQALPEDAALRLDRAVAAVSALKEQIGACSDPASAANSADLRDQLDLLALPGVETELPAALARRHVLAGPREIRPRHWLALLPPTGFLMTQVPTLRVQPFRRAVIGCDPSGTVTLRLPGARLLTVASGEVTPAGSALRVHRGADVTLGVLADAADRTPIAWLRVRALPEARLDLGFQLRIPRQPAVACDVLHRDGRIVCQMWLLVDRAGAIASA